MKHHQLGMVLFLLLPNAESGLEPSAQPVRVPPWLPDMPFICSFLMGLFPLLRYSLETLINYSCEEVEQSVPEI